MLRLEWGRDKIWVENPEPNTLLEDKAKDITVTKEPDTILVQVPIPDTKKISKFFTYWLLYRVQRCFASGDVVNEKIPIPNADAIYQISSQISTGEHAPSPVGLSTVNPLNAEPIDVVVIL